MLRRIVALFCAIYLSDCLTVHRKEDYDNIISNKKIEITPLMIECGLNDIIILSAPIINSETKYYLTSPLGDTFKINITRPTFPAAHITSIDDDYKHLIYKQSLDAKPIITLKDNYDLFNVNVGARVEDEDLFARKQAALRNDSFMIGPLQEGDHGNWVLSAYYEDRGWVEVYQVISIIIIELVPAVPKNKTHEVGETLEIGFAYPIEGLQSCQLTAPRSTYDRFYARSKEGLDQCKYIISNLTKDDEGIWKIMGVAKIAYETEMYLTINNKTL